jgi:hypothetical protein
MTLVAQYDACMSVLILFSLENDAQNLKWQAKKTPIHAHFTLLTAGHTSLHPEATTGWPE